MKSTVIFLVNEKGNGRENGGCVIKLTIFYCIVELKSLETEDTTKKTQSKHRS